MKYMEDDDSGTIFGDLRRIGVLTNDIFFHIYNDPIHNLKNQEPTYMPTVHPQSWITTVLPKTREKVNFKLPQLRYSATRMEKYFLLILI